MKRILVVEDVEFNRDLLVQLLEDEYEVLTAVNGEEGIGLAERERLLPPIDRTFFFSQLGRTFPAVGPRRARVALFAGCIAQVSFSALHDATIRVLTANGCEVVVPAGQTCCGALAAHAGVRDTARTLAHKNLDIFLRDDFDAVLKGMFRPRSETTRIDVADALGRLDIRTAQQTIVHRLKGNLALLQLALQILVPIEAELGRVGKIGAELQEERTEILVPAVKVIHVDHRRGM